MNTVELAAQLLELDEREAVLGDLAEAGEGAVPALLDILGLAVRRHLSLWKSWRPWVAAFGLALPESFLLMGFSLSVIWSYRHFLDDRAGFLALTGSSLLLFGSSWAGGYVVGSLSRRTLWVSIAACCSPCLFCLARFRVPALPRASLLLFLAPAIWGVYLGVRRSRIELRFAIVLAAGLTILMASTTRQGLNWVLVWPAWYMVATARSHGTC